MHAHRDKVFTRPKYDVPNWRATIFWSLLQLLQCLADRHSVLFIHRSGAAYSWREVEGWEDQTYMYPLSHAAAAPSPPRLTRAPPKKLRD